MRHVSNSSSELNAKPQHPASTNAMPVCAEGVPASPCPCAGCLQEMPRTSWRMDSSTGTGVQHASRRPPSAQQTRWMLRPSTAVSRSTPHAQPSGPAAARGHFEAMQSTSSSRSCSTPTQGVPPDACCLPPAHCLVCLCLPLSVLQAADAGHGHGQCDVSDGGSAGENLGHKV